MPPLFTVGITGGGGGGAACLPILLPQCPSGKVFELTAGDTGMPPLFTVGIAVGLLACLYCCLSVLVARCLNWQQETQGANGLRAGDTGMPPLFTVGIAVGLLACLYCCLSVLVARCLNWQQETQGANGLRAGDTGYASPLYCWYNRGAACLPVLLPQCPSGKVFELTAGDTGSQWIESRRHRDASPLYCWYNRGGWGGCLLACTAVSVS